MARTYGDAVGRWAGVGPYYAMFPVSFADHVVQTFTVPGQAVLDPFAGRGTAVFSAIAQGRQAVGIEQNPVGYVYAATKIRPAPLDKLLARLEQVSTLAPAENERSLPLFFEFCFAPQVRAFLLSARRNLDWRRSRTDRTLMALLLVYLHGKRGAALSNQMRQTKAMSPAYAIRWWLSRNMPPPDIDPLEFMKGRLEWRYKNGVPETEAGRVYLGDSREKLRHVRRHVQEGKLSRPHLLFTSPPYHAMTNYFYDQWLRLWLLGGPPNALLYGKGKGGKLESADRYRNLLRSVFQKAAAVLHEDATVYVRTGSRKVTRDATISALQGAFPEKEMSLQARPLTGRTQTRLFGSTNTPRRTSGELDIILVP